MTNHQRGGLGNMSAVRTLSATGEENAKNKKPHVVALLCVAGVCRGFSIESDC